MVISQKRLNFGMKRNYTIQDNTGGNGLENRCSIPELRLLRPQKAARPLRISLELSQTAEVTPSL